MQWAAAKGQEQAKGRTSYELSKDLGTWLTMWYDGDFIRDLNLKVTGASVSPSIVKYLQEQMEDLRRLCYCAKTVVSSDNTFNVGELHLTLTVFKHLALHRCDTNEPPMFIEPRLQPGSSTLEPFHQFSGKYRWPSGGCANISNGHGLGCWEGINKGNQGSLPRLRSSVLHQTYEIERCPPLERQSWELVS